MFRIVESNQYLLCLASVLKDAAGKWSLPANRMPAQDRNRGEPEYGRLSVWLWSISKKGQGRTGTPVCDNVVGKFTLEESKQNFDKESVEAIPYKDSCTLISGG